MARSILRRAAAWKATEDARGQARRRRRRAAPAIHHEAETTLAASSLPHIRARGSPPRAGFLSRAPIAGWSWDRAFGAVPAPSRCDAHDAHVTLKRRATSCRDCGAVEADAALNGPPGLDRACRRPRDRCRGSGARPACRCALLLSSRRLRPLGTRRGALCRNCPRDARDAQVRRAAPELRNVYREAASALLAHGVLDAGFRRQRICRAIL